MQIVSAFCPESMSTCLSRYHDIRGQRVCAPGQRPFLGPRADELPELRKRYWGRHFWRGAISAPPAATLQMKRYFSIQVSRPIGVSRELFSAPAASASCRAVDRAHIFLHTVEERLVFSSSVVRAVAWFRAGRRSAHQLPITLSSRSNAIARYIDEFYIPCCGIPALGYGKLKVNFEHETKQGTMALHKTRASPDFDDAPACGGALRRLGRR